MTALPEHAPFAKTEQQNRDARFAVRLSLVVGLLMPSLILQPIVENAPKHGLGPKPGQGHLWIAAEAHGDDVLLRVEDDGLGLVPAALRSTNSYPAELPSSGKREHSGNGRPPNGVGIENIAQRLTALYRDRGQITLEAREADGTRVKILFPRENGAAPL